MRKKLAKANLRELKPPSRKLKEGVEPRGTGAPSNEKECRSVGISCEAQWRTGGRLNFIKEGGELVVRGDERGNHK